MSSVAPAFPRASALIEQGISDGLHLGAQCSVSIDGQIADCEAFGEARPGHSMTTETIQCWLSSVKPVTAVAVLQLVQEGEWAMDQRIAALIPEFAAGGKEGITLRHLLTHTGGFRTGDALEWRDESWEAALARVCAAPLESGWSPGQRAGYHVEGSWYILGELLSRLTGQPFQQAIHERVFAPLDIRRGWIGMPEAVIERERPRIGGLWVAKADGCAPHPFADTEAGFRHVRPGSNGRGPIRELRRFYEDLLAGWLRDESRLLSRDMIRAMTSRQREGLVDETFRHRMDWGWGFALDNKRYGADTVPYGFGRHSSDTTFGHGGAQSSVAMADPDHALVIALAFNGMPGEPRHHRRLRTVLSALYEDLGLAG